jgi:hypothetical protein
MTDAHGRRSQRHPEEQELRRTVDASTALQELLAAAAAPPLASELKGHSRVVAEFRRARSGRPPLDSRADSLDPAWIDLHLPGSLADAHSARLPRTGTARGRSARYRPRFGCLGRWSAARLTVACAALLTVLGGTAAAAVAGELPVPVQNAVTQLFNATTPAGRSPAPGVTTASAGIGSASASTSAPTTAARPARSKPATSSAGSGVAASRPVARPATTHGGGVRTGQATARTPSSPKEVRQGSAPPAEARSGNQPRTGGSTVRRASPPQKSRPGRH